MTQEEITTIHEYLIEHDLLNEVEARTRKNWNTGSRTTYYSAIKNGKDGIRLSLSEGLMMLEAQKVVHEHNKANVPVELAAA